MKIEFPSHIKLVQAPVHSDKWHEHRLNYIGGSEVGTVLGINKWSSSVKLWYEKSLQGEAAKFDNEPMFWGRIMEPKIAEMWQYYNPETSDYINNYNAGNKVRQLYDIDGFLVNENYPWLSVALDRIIPKGEKTLLGQELTAHAPLEIKTIDHYAHQASNTGLPPYYEAQIMMQMIVTESHYGEFAYMVGGMKYMVEPREFHQGFADSIIETTHDFWYNHVLPARDIVQEIKESPAAEKRLRAKLNELEPAPDDSNMYAVFIKEQYQAEKEVMKAPDDLLWAIIEYDKAKKYINSLEKLSTYAKNHLIKCHKDNQVEIIDFGEAGKSSLGKQHRITTKDSDIFITESEAKENIDSIFYGGN
jgi:putative phage-type endonuclease